MLEGLVLEGKLERLLSLWVGDRLMLKSDGLGNLLKGGAMNEKTFLEAQSYILVAILKTLEEINTKLDKR